MKILKNCNSKLYYENCVDIVVEISMRISDANFLFYI